MHSKLMWLEIYFACTPWTFSLELHFFSRPLNVKFKGMVTHFPPSALWMLFWLENRDPDVELWALRVRPAKRGWEPSLGGTGSPTVSTGTFAFHSSPALWQLLTSPSVGSPHHRNDPRVDRALLPPREPTAECSSNVLQKTHQRDNLTRINVLVPLLRQRI